MVFNESALRRELNAQLLVVPFIENVSDVVLLGLQPTEEGSRVLTYGRAVTDSDFLHGLLLKL